MVRVRDNGTPPLSDSRAVDVTVRALRVVNILVPNGGNVRPFETEISWYTVPGQRYQLERKDHLHDAWELFPPFEANAPISSTIESTFFPSPQRFYRIQWIR